MIMGVPGLTNNQRCKYLLIRWDNMRGVAMVMRPEENSVAGELRYMEIESRRKEKG